MVMAGAGAGAEVWGGAEEDWATARAAEAMTENAAENFMV